jgi:hypothetical protein
MDFQSLKQLFATTYDSNPNNRKAGELAIRKVRAFREADSSVMWMSSQLILLTHHSLPVRRA